jgi:hypothetical protein
MRYHAEAVNVKRRSLALSNETPVISTPSFDRPETDTKRCSRKSIFYVRAAERSIKQYCGPPPVTIVSALTPGDFSAGRSVR